MYAYKDIHVYGVYIYYVYTCIERCIRTHIYIYIYFFFYTHTNVRFGRPSVVALPSSWPSWPPSRSSSARLPLLKSGNNY